MAPGLIGLVRFGRRAKSSTAHAQRSKQTFFNQNLPLFSADPFEHGTKNDVASIAVGEAVVRFELRSVRNDGIEIGQALSNQGLSWRTITAGVGASAGSMREKQLERDGTISRIHFRGAFWKNFGERFVPLQLPLLYEHGDQRCGHRLGARAKMKFISNGNRRRRTDFSQANGTCGQSQAALHHTRRDGRKPAFITNFREQFLDVLR